jgi:two-component system heavy metal sensor histidine kinase CusS
VTPFSLTARISLFFAGVVTAVLLATGLILARAADAHFRKADLDELEGKLDLISHLLTRAGSQAAFDDLPRQLDDALVGHPGLAVAVTDHGGNIWFATSGADFPHALLQKPEEASRALRQWSQGARSYRGMTRGVRAGTGEIHTVALALDMHDHEAFMSEFRRMLVLAMALAALATAGLGWIATRRGLNPLRRIADTAASVSAERLGARLPAKDVPLELKALVASFNAMLARLDESFRRLSDFSSDIAHELRTPIGNLLTQTQVALTRARSPEVYRDVLHSNLEEYERLSRMVGDMLFLAKADNRLIVPRREAVDLGEEVARLLEFHEAQASDRDVRLACQGSARVSGDRLMLQRAVSNLLSNAIRHTAAGGTVRVAVTSEAEAAVVAVENPGPGIPPEHLSQLFERFHRGEPARHEGPEEHHGLGLAITRSIVEAHGGSASVASAEGRTRFELRLPYA